VDRPGRPLCDEFARILLFSGEFRNAVNAPSGLGHGFRTTAFVNITPSALHDLSESARGNAQEDFVFMSRSEPIGKLYDLP